MLLDICWIVYHLYRDNDHNYLLLNEQKEIIDRSENLIDINNLLD